MSAFDPKQTLGASVVEALPDLDLRQEVLHHFGDLGVGAER